MAVHQETGARKVRDSLRTMSTVKPAGVRGDVDDLGVFCG